MVPLAVLDSGKIPGRILVLQPRRIVCIEAAKRMAQMWGETVGQTVGYRIRHDNNCGPNTQLEIITEGILLRMLQNNPTLEGIGAIFFDEFHERNLDCDMSLTLALQTQTKYNPELRLVVMSATLGGLGDRLSQLMRCPLVFSEGRCFPVDVNHVGNMGELAFQHQALRDHELECFVAGQVANAIKKHEGDILVFLPGEAEIMYTWAELNNLGYGDGSEPKNLSWQARQIMEEGQADPSKCIDVIPLYGSMSREDQELALQPREGWRKVLLATPIAESSLTLPGIKVVIDTGLRRTVFTDPNTGITFMRTVPVSAASADQRKGRAGRVSPGTCYRVWNEKEQERLQEQDQPELHLGDLCSCVLDLSLANCCSETAIAELPWVDPPQKKQLKEACALLARIKAIEHLEGENGIMLDEWQLTDRGRQLSRFPLHPRLAHMILQARHISKACVIDACHLAALLEDKEILRGGKQKYGCDAQIRLDAFKEALARDLIKVSERKKESKLVADVNSFVKRRVSRTSQQLLRLAKVGELKEDTCSWGGSVGVLIAWACPELLAEKQKAMSKKQKSDARWGIVNYRTHSGNECRIQKDNLTESQHIAIAKAHDTKVFLAAEVHRPTLWKYGIDIERPSEHAIHLEAKPEDDEEIVAARTEEISGAQMATIEELCSVDGKQMLKGTGLTTWDDLQKRLRRFTNGELKRINAARSLETSVPKLRKLDNLMEYLRVQAA